eukprot:Gb_39235 [translate_table: standard]
MPNPDRQLNAWSQFQFPCVLNFIVSVDATLSAHEGYIFCVHFETWQLFPVQALWLLLLPEDRYFKQAGEFPQDAVPVVEPREYTAMRIHYHRSSFTMKRIKTIPAALTFRSSHEIGHLYRVAFGQFPPVLL